MTQHLQHQQMLGYNPKTVDASRRALEAFRLFCAPFEVHCPAHATAEHALAWRERLEWQPQPSGRLSSPHTVQLYVMMASRFFRWALKANHILINPFAHIQSPRIRYKERRVLSVEEMKRLLAIPDLQSLRGPRDRAILELVYGTGMRREECCRLDLDDVDFDQATVRVKGGKNGIERLLPLGIQALEALRGYVEGTRLLFFAQMPDAALFLGVWGGRIGLHGLSKIVAENAFNAGLGRVGFHLLRHAFATHLLENGARVEEVAQLLGHQRLSCTDKYTHVMPRLVAQEHRRSHPRARRNPARPPTSAAMDDAAAMDEKAAWKRLRKKS